MNSCTGSIHGIRRVIAGLWAVGFVVVTARARSDLVEPRPDACPPGAIGQASHAGPYCAPTTCATDEDCSRNMEQPSRKRVCREQPLCVHTEPIKSRLEGVDAKRTVASGVCPGGDGCAAP